jgi:hypothetical protein
MTIKDNIEVVHSEKKDGKVRVCFEQPVFQGFNSIECVLPDYKWSENQGFDDKTLKYLEEYIHSMAHIIIELAEEGGFE